MGFWLLGPFCSYHGSNSEGHTQKAHTLPSSQVSVHISSLIKLLSCPVLLLLTGKLGFAFPLTIVSCACLCGLLLL